MRYSSLSSLLLLVLLAACQFDSGIVACDDGTTPGPRVPTTIRDLQTQLGAPRQTFTYQPGQTNTFTGAKGTIVTIPAGAFQKFGRPVTTPVQLTLREVYDRATMVLSNTPTVTTRGSVLESAGEVYLRADQDTSLRLAPGVVIRLQTPNPPNLASTDSMRLFVAPFIPPGCFGWTLYSDAFSDLTPIAGGNILTIGQALYNNGYGWFNCDRFYGAGASLPVVVQVRGAGIEPTNTAVFVVFRDFNGALALCDYTQPDIFTARFAPAGARVSVVVIRTIDGKIYYGRQDDTVQPNQSFSPPLLETTAAELLADLQRI
ncbi:hypothetical protein [Hymenobacter actinosclerus]|uniref:Outer membrane protein assembly factor BamB n=1 Tax=Hymenobacter actinosclerus TaxID=82805 RepID=A0A1I0BJ41_9BACT|nr:hypothetical protein [Hymenobacter actinosclerus]SET06854.1 outer membrane protein assembly factor BamB [Hymenobacter actinosclerus]